MQRARVAYEILTSGTRAQVGNFGRCACVASVGIAPTLGWGPGSWSPHLSVSAKTVWGMGSRVLGGVACTLWVPHEITVELVNMYIQKDIQYKCPQSETSLVELWVCVGCPPSAQRLRLPTSVLASPAQPEGGGLWCQLLLGTLRGFGGGVQE